MALKEGNTTTRIEVTVLNSAGLPDDVSGANTIVIIVVDPDGNLVSQTAAFDAEEGNGLGTDGKIFISWATPLVIGEYSYEAETVTGALVYRTDFATFTVIKKLKNG